MCDCVCLCVCVYVSVCVRAWCVCVMRVWCVSVSVCECVCVILLLYVIKSKKNVWCVLYTLTHSLTLTHSRSHTLAHLHAHTHAHALHTLKEWICVDYNSTQFDSFWVNWSCTAPIQSNSIWNWIGNFEFDVPNSTPFELRWINAKWRRIALNNNALCLVHLSDAPNTDSVHSKKILISSKIKPFGLIVPFFF